MFQSIINLLKFWKYNTHPARMESRSRSLVLFGTKRAHECFKDEKFRGLIKFDQQSQTEQDRIFNELVVTNIVSLMLLLDQSVQETVAPDKKEYLKALRSSVPEYYGAFLRRVGMEEEFAIIWDKLIQLRYDEYSNDMLEVRREFFNAGEKDLNEFAHDNRLMIFQTIALGLYRHLTHGKIKKGDPLYLFLQKYLVPIQKHLVRKTV